MGLLKMRHEMVKIGQESASPPLGTMIATQEVARMRKHMNKAKENGDAHILESVLRAVEDPQWDFRTSSSIAFETGYPENKVKDLLLRNPHLFRRSRATDKSGKPLFTSTSRPIQWRE